MTHSQCHKPQRSTSYKPPSSIRLFSPWFSPVYHVSAAPAAPLPWLRRLSIRRAETCVTRAARDVLGLTIFLSSMTAMVSQTTTDDI